MARNVLVVRIASTLRHDKKKGEHMIHELKIKQCYLCHILEGSKTFEVRKNDRDFQVGDLIRFLPIEDENYNVYEIKSPIPEYKINYILSGFEGLQHNHVCLAITPVDASTLRH